MKLSPGHRHILNLLRDSPAQGPDGYVPVSLPVMGLIQNHIPGGLVEIQFISGRGAYARLTERGAILCSNPEQLNSYRRTRATFSSRPSTPPQPTKRRRAIDP